jgi:hypothetical protein
MPDLIRHPVLPWIPAFAGMTGLVFIVAGVIMTVAALMILAGCACKQSGRKLPALF